MVIIGGKNCLILEKTEIVSNYNEEIIYKNVIVLEKSDNAFLSLF